MIKIKSNLLKNEISKSGGVFSYYENIKNERIEVFAYYNQYVEDIDFQVFYTYKNDNSIQLYTKKEDDKIIFLYDYNFIKYKDSFVYIINSINEIIKELYKRY